MMHPIPDNPFKELLGRRPSSWANQTETARAKGIIAFLAKHPSGARWGKALVKARNENNTNVEFAIYDKLHALVFTRVDNLRFIHAMNRVFYILRDGTYLHPHERKGKAS